MADKFSDVTLRRLSDRGWLVRDVRKCEDIAAFSSFGEMMEWLRSNLAKDGEKA